MIRKIEISDKISYKEELHKVLDYLLETHPLVNHTQLVVNIKMTKRWYPDGKCFNRSFSDGLTENRVSEIYIDVTDKPMIQILKTIAHEYCHALQNDNPEESESKRCTSKTTKRKGGAPWETKADIFSIRVLATYFSKSNQQMVNETGINFYEKSKPSLYEELKVDPQLVLESPEQKQRDIMNKA